MKSAEEKRADAEAKRRQRDQKAHARGSHCRARLGPHAVCGGRLVVSTDLVGRTLVHCPLCDRKRAGVCRLCPQPVAGRKGWAIYCAPCKRAKALPAQRRRWIEQPYNYRRKLALNRAWRRKRARQAA